MVRGIWEWNKDKMTAMQKAINWKSQNNSSKNVRNTNAQVEDSIVTTDISMRFKDTDLPEDGFF